MKKYLSLVKFSHTIFALPFAIVGLVLGLKTYTETNSLYLAVIVIGCMVTARNAAMGFNRLVDRNIDAQNERTKNRDIPSGSISIYEARLFILVNCILFITFTYFINPLVFYLSPVALLIILGYSYTKRFTWLSHLILGAGLGLAPLGAYLSVTGSFEWLPIIYGIAVMFWVAGFDIIYAMQDENFDQDAGLKSIPSTFGGKNAMLISKILHTLSAVAIIIAGFYLSRDYEGNHYLHWVGVLLFIGFLIYQHTLVSYKNLERVDAAFFMSNGIASILFGILAVTDFLVYL